MKSHIFVVEYMAGDRIWRPTNWSWDDEDISLNLTKSNGLVALNRAKTEYPDGIYRLMKYETVGEEIA